MRERLGGRFVRDSASVLATQIAMTVLSVGTSVSHSDVRYIGKGKLQSKGSSAIHDIDILGGAVHIDTSSVSAANCSIGLAFSFA